MIFKIIHAHKLVFFIAIMALLTTSAVPMSVGATPINPQGPNPPVQDIPAEFAGQANQAMAYENAIRAMEKYISVAKDGTLVLSVKSGKSMGVDEKIFQQLTKALEETNKQLRSGKLSLAEVHLDSGTSSLDSGTSAMGDAVTCAGINGFVIYWWGLRAYFDSCRTQSIISAMNNGGAAVCALIGRFGIPYAGGVCNVIMVVGRTYITWLNNTWGRGIVVNHTWVTGSVPWIWHQ